MVGEVVVVFDGLEGGGLAEEAEMVDGNWVREEGLDCCGYRMRWGFQLAWGGLPSSMPRPERRMGTRQT